MLPLVITGNAAESAISRSSSASDLIKVVRDYLAADSDKRKGILAKLAADPGDILKAPSEIDRWANTISKEADKIRQKIKIEKTDLLAKLDAKRQALNRQLGCKEAPVCTLETPVGQMRVMVLEAKNAKKPAALIYLHGGGHMGGDHPGNLDNEMAWGWGLLRVAKIPCSALRLVPRCLDDKAVNAWILPSEARAVDDILTTLMRHYDIDPNRVYLMGTSMGGFGSWLFAALNADRFAAIASLSGGCTLSEQETANLRNIAFGVFIGDADTAANRLAGARRGRDILQKLHAADSEGYKFEYHEYPGVGHNLPDKAYEDVNKFFENSRRCSYPRRVVWYPMVEWKTRFYNIGIATPRKGMKIDAQMKPDNTVIVASENVPAFSIFLSSELVDWKKTVRIIWNGKEVYNQEVQPRLSVILETLVERCDLGMYYAGRIDLTAG